MGEEAFSVEAADDKYKSWDDSREVCYLKLPPPRILVTQEWRASCGRHIVDGGVNAEP